MGHQFIIDDDEAFAMATELPSRTGKSLEVAVTEALRMRLAAELARLAEMERMRRAVEEFQSTLQEPWPSPDHSWLYDDETGLPA